MNETSQSTLYHRFLKGEVRVDGWQSDWQKEMKRRSAEDKVNRISAPHIEAKNCPSCPRKLNHMNKCGVCIRARMKFLKPS